MCWIVCVAFFQASVVLHVIVLALGGRRFLEFFDALWPTHGVEMFYNVALLPLAIWLGWKHMSGADQ